MGATAISASLAAPIPQSTRGIEFRGARMIVLSGTLARVRSNVDVDGYAGWVLNQGDRSAMLDVRAVADDALQFPRVQLDAQGLCVRKQPLDLGSMSVQVCSKDPHSGR